MSKWFYINFSGVLVVIWSVFNQAPISVYVWFGYVGALLIIFNWTRHAVFSTIRDSTIRKRKVRLATLSKKILPYHKWVGSLALIFVLVHGTLVIERYGFHWDYPKMLVGLLTASILTLQVATGWMRLYRPTIKKRKVHIYSGMTLFFLLVLHLIL
ncbi:hypothetical protein J5S49_04230 [Virgibacillus halodenitrificans]|uniref:Uncharacterized protein n=1 Tax=Virgibacillus halodenitrificans TaxID=1482 RepID=A0AAC9NJV5_VIRHA|nr:hypothetical protein [Virgibacillus halodenitrificans]APC46916.1 hypothetical protein BME96_01340 [Virgibacillus halodenitrificans]MCG1027493.1 hypothetical protein [Virgibacillus halodenitrificans]WHX25366.1 hypothetical protein QNH47_14535 [Virgibacillus halodenitrificans]